MPQTNNSNIDVDGNSITYTIVQSLREINDRLEEIPYFDTFDPTDENGYLIDKDK